MANRISQQTLQTEMHSKRQPPTPEQIRAQQLRDAEKDRTAVQPHQPQANLPAVARSADVVPMPALNSAEDYFSRNPGRMVVGRPIRPNLKLGRWVYADDDSDTPLLGDAEYIAIYDGTWCGWVRLEADQPPQYDGGLLFTADYHRHSREELHDLDPASWPLSQFDNLPQDPWREAVYLPLEQRPTGELCTIQIQSKPRSAAIFAIDGLLSHCRQLMRRDPDSYPIVKLGIGQYESRKFGQQYKPLFRIVGKAPKSGHARPEASSIADDMNDSVGF